MMNRRFVIGLTCALMVLLLIPMQMTRAMDESNTPHNGDIDEELLIIETLGDFKTLKELLEDYREQQVRYSGDISITMMEDALEMAPAEAPAAESRSSMDTGSGTADFSVTNIQVAGVDEGDRVKTDGKHLYRINPDHIAILQVRPEADMKMVGQIDLDPHFSPRELYLDGDKLVVIGSGWMARPPRDPILYDSVEPQAGSGVSGNAGSSAPTVDSALLPDVLPQMDRSMIYPPYWWEPAATTLKIYDVSNPANPSPLREVVVEGSLLSSRKIDQDLYLVANRYLEYYWIMQERPGQAEELLQPVFKDTAVADGELQKVDYDAIGYFPGAVEPNYITILGLSLDELTKPAEVEVFLGRGQNIYASRENLYMAMEKWSTPEQGIQPMPRGGWMEETHTDLYRFALDGGTIRYTATGQVPGRILNQFSMDEHEGTFRIATTTGQMWRTDEGASKNHLYVLDENLKRLGQIEDIAPTERIYSVRFMGDRAYMVTFREIDPFYVIDLTNPEKPSILGYLKIPGYSDYLHPYDDNHIIGFGKEVYDVKGNAIPGGFKMGVFDVTNVASPVEKFKLEIGDTGTDSDLLWDHKALLFSRERNLIAFPITIMTKPAGSDDNPWQWGQFSFQGALVYGLDLNTGFTRKAAISHLGMEDYLKAGSYWYDSDKNVDRILYVGDTLITTSNSKVQRHDQQRFQLMDEVILK